MLAVLKGCKYCISGSGGQLEREKGLGEHEVEFEGHCQGQREKMF